MSVAFIYSMIFLVAVALDQLSKYLIVMYIKPLKTLPLIANVLHFTYAENTGAAFSIFRGMQSFLVLLTSIGMALIFVFMVRLKGDNQAFLRFSLAFILAGGVGNLIDRLRMGYVVDFIDVRLINFAIFNLADVFISLGVFFLVIDSLFISKTLLK